MAGYISSTAADVVQPQSAIDMIVSIYCYGVLVIWAAVILVLYSWKLEKIYPQIVKDLAERAARGEM